LLASIQQQAANPQGPYQPDDLAYLTQLVVEQNVSLYEAVRKTNERAQERQAQQAPQGSPETMPGLAMPGMGAEMQAAVPPEEAAAAAAPQGIEALLAQLGGAA
jgi:hypothetical protein